MTGRERMQALLNRELPDRYGLFEHFWPETLQDYWPEQGYPVDRQGKPVNPVNYFDFDLEPAGGEIDTVPRRGYLEVIEETDEWRVTRDGRGAVLKHWKKKSGTPEHIGFAVTTPKKWKEYKEYLTGFDPARVDIEATKSATHIDPCCCPTWTACRIFSMAALNPVSSLSPAPAHSGRNTPDVPPTKNEAPS